MIDRIETYYNEKLGDEEKRWIEQNIAGFSSDAKDKFMDLLCEEQKKAKGCPDISMLGRILQAVTGKAPKVYYWSVCLECHTGYDYRLPMCPKCYDNGLACYDREIKISDFPPPMNVIRYNYTEIL